MLFRSIALWGTLKKKPLVTLPNAHLGQNDTANSVHNDDFVSVSDDDVEPDDIHSEMSSDLSPQMTLTTLAEFSSMQKENWVTSVAALHNTDLVVSGNMFHLLVFCYLSHKV